MSEIICCVTLDVEADRDTNYCLRNPWTFNNVLHAIPNLLEPLFLQNNIKPTYFVGPEVLVQRECIKTLSSIRSGAEIGAHLHPEFISDNLHVINPGVKTSRFLGDESEEVLRRKIEWLTHLFIGALGYTPQSFRGGRFAINTTVLSILQELGYIIDSSVTPGLYWRGTDRTLNYIDAPEQPYFPSSSDITKPGEMKMLEIPISTWRSSNRNKSLAKFAANINVVPRFIWPFLDCAVAYFTSQVYWLRPTANSKSMMQTLVKEWIERHSKSKIIYAVIMFHPMELIPGASPYAKTPEEVNAIMLNLNELINVFGNFGAKFPTLKEAAFLWKERIDVSKKINQ